MMVMMLLKYKFDVRAFSFASSRLCYLLDSYCELITVDLFGSIDTEIIWM